MALSVWRPRRRTAVGFAAGGALARDIYENPLRYARIAQRFARLGNFYRRYIDRWRRSGRSWRHDSGMVEEPEQVPWRGVKKRNPFSYMPLRGGRYAPGIGRAPRGRGRGRRSFRGKRKRVRSRFRGALSKKARRTVKAMIAGKAMWTKWNRHYNLSTIKYSSPINIKELNFSIFNTLTSLNGYIDSHVIEFPAASGTTTLDVTDLRGRDVIWNIKSSFSIYMKNNYAYKAHVDLYWFVAKTNTSTSLETTLKDVYDRYIVGATGTSFETADANTWESMGCRIGNVLHMFKRYWKLVKRERATIHQTTGKMFMLKRKPRFFNSVEFATLTSTNQLGLTYTAVWHQYGEVAHSDEAGEQALVGYSSSLLDAVITNNTWLRVKYPKLVNPLHIESNGLDAITQPSVATLALEEQQAEEVPT